MRWIEFRRLQFGKHGSLGFFALGFLILVVLPTILYRVGNFDFVSVEFGGYFECESDNTDSCMHVLKSAIDAVVGSDSEYASRGIRMVETSQPSNGVVVNVLLPEILIDNLIFNLRREVPAVGGEIFDRVCVARKNQMKKKLDDTLEQFSILTKGERSDQTSSIMANIKALRLAGYSRLDGYCGESGSRFWVDDFKVQKKNYLLSLIGVSYPLLMVFLLIAIRFRFLNYVNEEQD